MSKTSKRYKCPYCEYRHYRDKLILHVEEDHEDMIPKDYTPSRVVYNAVNKRDHGTCMICHSKTEWDENKQRYNTLCGNPKCKTKYVEIVRSRMVKKYGTHNLLNDPEFQKKMLENRSISGKYKFEDGGSIGYVGSYEKKFLEFMDKFLHIKSYDIISPGPNIPYMYKGKEHVWITDFLYEPYNLVFDIKDGGDNPNTRSMEEYREKQIAKEKAIAEYGEYNYIRLTDNKFEQLISIFMELKEKEEHTKPLIRINESYIEESKNKSSYNKNFKKKTRNDFTIYDIHDSKASKYIKNDSKWNDTFDYLQNNCNGEIAVDNSGKIIGRILIKEKEHGTSISGFYVDKDYRGYGIGETLFDDAVNKYNGEILEVYSDNKVAIHMYEKYGFKVVDTHSDEDGKIYVMKRNKI